MLQSVAVCCSMSQCVVVCCSVLQCVADHLHRAIHPTCPSEVHARGEVDVGAVNSHTGDFVLTPAAFPPVRVRLCGCG